MEKECKKCGIIFGTEIVNKIYCSVRCYKLAKALRHYKKYGRGKGICILCGKEYKISQKGQRFCSIECSSISRKKYFTIPECLENPKRKIDKNIGYVRIYVPMHPKANTWGYVYEHVVIMEKELNRFLLEDEVVHHINGVRWDNRIENLKVMNKIEHSKIKPK
jgi:hypothetical protein